MAPNRPNCPLHCLHSRPCPARLSLPTVICWPLTAQVFACTQMHFLKKKSYVVKWLFKLEQDFEGTVYLNLNVMMYWHPLHSWRFKFTLGYTEEIKKNWRSHCQCLTSVCHPQGQSRGRDGGQNLYYPRPMHSPPPVRRVTLPLFATNYNSSNYTPPLHFTLAHTPPLFHDSLEGGSTLSHHDTLQALQSDTRSAGLIQLWHEYYKIIWAGTSTGADRTGHKVGIIWNTDIMMPQTGTAMVGSQFQLTDRDISVVVQNSIIMHHSSEHPSKTNSEYQSIFMLFGEFKGLFIQVVWRAAWRQKKIGNVQECHSGWRVYDHACMLE